MIRLINKFIFFKLLGWKITGKVPDDKKIVAIVAPHTSSLDFFVGDLIFFISNKSFLRSLTIQIKSKPPRIFIK